MEQIWTFEHFSFELVVQVLSILISAGIGWFIWKAQFKVSKEDVVKQKNVEDDKRLQTLLQECLLTVSDNKNFIKEALRFQIYSAQPYEVKSWVAGLQYSVKYDVFSNLLNSGLVHKMPENIEKLIKEVRLKLFEMQKNLNSSVKKFEFYSSNKTYETNARSDWDNLKIEFGECIKSLGALESALVVRGGRVEFVSENL